MAALYREHKPLVEHVVRRMGVPDRDVEDVVHDAFIEIGASLRRLDPERGDGLAAWLGTIAWRTARDHLALHRSTEAPMGADVEALLAEDATLETKLIEEEPRALLRDLIGRGDEVLFRFIYREQTYAQIAKELGITVTTVQSRIRKAQDVLAARLRQRRAVERRRRRGGGSDA